MKDFFKLRWWKIIILVIILNVIFFVSAFSYLYPLFFWVNLPFFAIMQIYGGSWQAGNFGGILALVVSNFYYFFLACFILWICGNLNKLGFKGFIKKYWILILGLIIVLYVLFPKSCGHTSGFWAKIHEEKDCVCNGVKFGISPGEDAGTSYMCSGFCGQCVTTCKIMSNVTGSWEQVPCD